MLRFQELHKKSSLSDKLTVGGMCACSAGDSGVCVCVLGHDVLDFAGTF